MRLNMNDVIEYNPDGTATVTKNSVVSGKRHSMRMTMTKDQYEQWEHGGLIQNVFPHLTVQEREFLMTGITGEEWEKEFPDNE